MWELCPAAARLPFFCRYVMGPPAAMAGIGVGCISLEMRASQLVRRLTIIHSKVEAQLLRDARNLTPQNYRHVKNSMIELRRPADHHHRRQRPCSAQIASQTRQMAQRRRPHYLRGLRTEIIHEDGKERREAINRVSASLRDTCKALNIPFVVGSQLARRDADLEPPPNHPGPARERKLRTGRSQRTFALPSQRQSDGRMDRGGRNHYRQTAGRCHRSRQRHLRRALADVQASRLPLERPAGSRIAESGLTGGVGEVDGA